MTPNSASTTRQGGELRPWDAISRRSHGAPARSGVSDVPKWHPASDEQKTTVLNYREQGAA